MNPLAFIVGAGLLCTLAHGDAVQAADAKYPARPVRYIVAFAAGGASDVVARIVADGLASTLGQNVVVDNRTGANGIIGAEAAAKATPDGYTLFACNIASLAVSPALYRKLGYDPGSFSPIALVASNPNALSVTASLPATSVAEFVALAKARPGKLNYASAGAGTSPQLSMELFKLQAQIDVVHIPYRAISTAIVDLMAGQIQSMFSTVPSALGPSRTGKVRVLGVTSRTRAPDMPEVPTIAEQGMPGFEVVSWQGVCMPGGVPKATVELMATAVKTVLANPETGKRLGDQGFHLNSLGPEEFAAFINAERTRWTKLIRDLGIEPK